MSLCLHTLEEQEHIFNAWSDLYQQTAQAKVLPKAHFQATEKAIIYAMGIHEAFANGLLELAELKDKEWITLIHQARAMQLPFFCWARDRSKEHLMLEQGLNYALELKSVLLDLNELQIPPARSEISVLEVNDDDLFEEYLQVTKEGFPMSDQGAVEFTQVLKWCSANGICRHFLGKVNEEPVVSLMLSSRGETCSLWNYATREKYRGKGYGKVLLQHVLEEAKRGGAERCVAFIMSDPSFNNFMKAGFKHVGSHYIFVDIPKRVRDL